MLPNLQYISLSVIGPSVDDIRHFIGNNDGASYAIAEQIMKVVNWLLGIFGLEHDQNIVTFLYAAVVFGVALIVGWITQRVVLSLVRVVTKHWSSDIYETLKDVKFFHKICRIIPGLVYLILIQFTLSNHTSLSGILTKLTLVYVTFITAVAFTALVVAIWKQIDKRANKRKLPLTGLAQLVKGIIWILAAIIIVCVIIDQSPAKLLAGLGAFAAVLMLVFKDSILGLVAGLQLSQNDMLRVGDWIVVPSTLANGIVTDVSLTAVKVQNFDNTIVTLPPYTLISSSFQNWRGMADSGCRRIARSVIIDSDTIVEASPELIETVSSKFPIIKNYLAHIKELGHPDYNPGLAVVNGTDSTNLGLFRIYMCQWLINNPAISNDSQILVRIMDPNGEGIPLQIYCFTTTTKWTAYEAIQSAVIEHVAVTAQQFGLRLFNDPSGTDVTTVRLTDQSPQPSPQSQPSPTSNHGSAANE